MPLFSDNNPEFPMPPKKEETINFRCDEETKAFIYELAGDLDVPVSDVCRVGALLAAGQLRTCPALINITIKDIRPVPQRL